MPQAHPNNKLLTEISNLYKHRFTDAEIAEECKVSEEFVRFWRTCNGLPQHAEGPAVVGAL